jgi:hypothetical protein
MLPVKKLSLKYLHERKKGRKKERKRERISTKILSLSNLLSTLRASTSHLFDQQKNNMKKKMLALL